MPEIANQSPEQWARDEIDSQLRWAGWCVQSRNELDANAGCGITVREYPTDVGPMDYALFVDGESCGPIKARAACAASDDLQTVLRSDPVYPRLLKPANAATFRRALSAPRDPFRVIPVS